MAISKAKLKPLISKKLRALGLDIEIQNAKGNQITYTNEFGHTKTASDFIGGYGANLLGHNHSNIKNVVLEHIQNNHVVHGQLSDRRPSQDLANQLSGYFFSSFGESAQCFIGNTGAEAVEIALKQCILRSFQQKENILKYHNSPIKLTEEAQELYSRVTSKILDLNDCFQDLDSFNAKQFDSRPWLALENSYHGKTLLSLSVTSNSYFRKPFATHLDQVEFVNLQNSDFQLTIPVFASSFDGHCLTVDVEYIGRYKGFIFEPIQGEAGIHEIKSQNFTSLLNALRDAQTPIIIDEIQSGLGRSGHFFYAKNYNICPDIVLLGKSLGGSICKISAVLTRSSFYDESFDDLHSSTFSDDELSSKVALEALRTLETENISNRCEEMGQHIKAQLKELQEKHPQIIKSVRGKGLLLAIEFFDQTQNTSSMIRFFNDQDVLGYLISSMMLHKFGVRIAPTLSSPLSLRIEPSYLVSKSEVQNLIQALDFTAMCLDKAHFGALAAHLIEKDLISICDYNTYPRKIRREQTSCTKKVAFIAHMISIEDMAMVDPSLSQFSVDELDRLHRRSEYLFKPSLFDQFEVVSSTGERTLFHFISLYERPKTLEKALRSKDTKYFVERIQDAVDLAKDLGCQCVGLGGFTSILTHNGHLINSRGMTLTTGNSFTVASTIQSILIGCKEKHIQPHKASLAIIGAPGNIGSLCSELAAEKFERLTLTGRAGSLKSLKRLAARIVKKCLENPRWPLSRRLALNPIFRNFLQTGFDKTQLDDFLQTQNTLQVFDHIPHLDSEAILTCTNSTHPLLFDKNVSQQTKVIIDTAVPYNVSNELKEQRKDILFAQGGLVSIPNAPDFYVSGIPTEYGSTLACLSETLILSLEGHIDNFSYGLLKREQIDFISQLASKHGFKIGTLKQDPVRYFYPSEGMEWPSRSPSRTKHSSPA